MADTKKEILDFSLNGTDWSNIYHVDYSGGSGGEKLAETIARKVNAENFSVDYNHGQIDVKNYGIKDSFLNQYTQPTVYNYTLPFLLYPGNIDDHTMYEVGSNLKLLRYYRPEIIKTYNSEPTKLPTEDDKRSMVKIHRDHSSLILRTHMWSRHWEALSGMKSLYMYPTRQTHIITLRMFLRRWFNRKDLAQEKVHQLLGDEMYKWFTEKYKSDDGYYAWQIETALKNIDNFYNGMDFRTDWENFVDSWISEHTFILYPRGIDEEFYKTVPLTEQFFSIDLENYNRRKKLIDPYDWCFGDTNDVFINIRNAIGLDLMSSDVERWQIENRKEIENQGISIEEEDPLVCREFIINYFHNKGLKIGGLR